MNITLKYTVHSVTVDRVPIEAIANGQTVLAHVDRLVVELTADDGDHGHTFRLPVVAFDLLAAQRAAFAVGTAITLTLEPGVAA